MIKQSIVGLAVCLLLLAGSNVGAQTNYVLDTGDPNERVCNPRSYTDLGNGIVRDNVTGLEWVQDGNLIASRNPEFDNDYTAGDGRVTWQSALDYIALLNTDNYLGYSDWRLPTIEELSSIVDAGRYLPAIGPVFDTEEPWIYWSSTSAFINDVAWLVRFYYGHVATQDKTDFANYIRAVRGGEHYVSVDNFVSNGDGTVSDVNTGLMWQHCNYGQTWDDAQCTGNAGTLTWDEAVAYVQELNDNNTLGYSDWRLPTINELQSLVDYTRIEPATTFPNVPLSVFSEYWSSTILVDQTEAAWCVFFSYGYKEGYSKPTPLYVRAVRGGPCRSSGGWCINDSDCKEGYECVNGSCEIIDDPPAIGDGPFLAAGSWPVMSTFPESAFALEQKYRVVWTFSDDYGSCSGPCTHVAWYKNERVLGDEAWIPLTVSTDPTGEWYAWVELPVEDLQNGETYALRFSVTDCAAQTTHSDTYYFRPALFDDPPVIESGPFLAAGSWPVLPASQSKAFVLDRKYRVLWTFSDDYASCRGPCTHRARYRRVDEELWTWLPVKTDPTGEWYAYVDLPDGCMDNGTYMFHFDVRDCSGLLTRASKIYYFTIAAPDDARWKEFSSRVASSSDDGMEQTNTGEIILCNGINALTLLDIDLGRDDDYYGGTSCLRACACNEAVLSAMRFTGVTVPSEVDGVPVTLENAYIEFTARESSGRTMFRNAALKLTITAQAADNPPTLGTSDYNISDRPDTVASVAWNVPEGAWISGQTYMTPDIKPIIQELINRPGWQDGNAMLFKIEAGLEDGGRVAHSFESNFNLAPRLVIKYSACE